MEIINVSDFGYRNPKFMDYYVNLRHFESVTIVTVMNQETGTVDDYHITFFKPGSEDCDNELVHQPQWHVAAEDHEKVTKLRAALRGEKI